MPEFVPGLELSESFYFDVVKPILESDFPGLTYSAALIGSGSEVVGFDTARSTDHHWGPRVMLFLSELDHLASATALSDDLSAKLPYTFRGYSTNFGEPDAIGVRLMRDTDAGPVRHMIQILTVRSFFMSYLGFDPEAPIHVSDWLTFPEHRLLAVTSGKVFHDGLGDLTRIREQLSYYPHDLWLYLMAVEWEKISQEEAFVGRCGDVGDDLGSRIIASRLVRRLMRLCFLMKRVYPPYPKWFGTAFSRLESAQALAPILADVLSVDTWKEREAHMSEAYRIVAEMHNALEITAPLETTVSSYHERPYMVIRGDRFSAAIRESMQDEEIRRLPLNVGSLNQLVESSDTLEDIQLCRTLKVLYE